MAMPAAFEAQYFPPVNQADGTGKTTSIEFSFDAAQNVLRADKLYKKQMRRIIGGVLAIDLLFLPFYIDMEKRAPLFTTWRGVISTYVATLEKLSFYIHSRGGVPPMAL